MSPLQERDPRSGSSISRKAIGGQQLPQSIETDSIGEPHSWRAQVVSPCGRRRRSIPAARARYCRRSSPRIRPARAAAISTVLIIVHPLLPALHVAHDPGIPRSPSFPEAFRCLGETRLGRMEASSQPLNQTASGALMRRVKGLRQALRTRDNERHLNPGSRILRILHGLCRVWRPGYMMSPAPVRSSDDRPIVDPEALEQGETVPPAFQSKANCSASRCRDASCEESSLRGWSEPDAVDLDAAAIEPTYQDEVRPSTDAPGQSGSYAVEPLDGVGARSRQRHSDHRRHTRQGGGGIALVD